MIHGRNQSHKSGFSAIELMVSIVVVALLLVFLYFIVKANRPQRLLDQARNELISQHQQLTQRIKLDLDEAIRNWGASASLLPGIDRYGGVPRDQTALPNGEDGLQLIIEKFGNFELRAKDYGANTIDFEIPDEATRDLFTGLFGTKDYFLLSQFEQSTIIKRTGPAEEVDSATLRVPVNALHFRRVDFEDKASALRPAELVVYRLDRGRLLRTVTTTINPGSSTTILAENLVNIQVDYSYRNSRTDGTNVVLPPATQRLTHHRDPSYYNCGAGGPAPGFVCCDPTTQACVEPYDIQSARVVLTLEVPLASSAHQLASFSQGFQLNNGKLQYRGETYIYPRRFQAAGGISELQGTVLACPLNDLSSRCNENCDSSFGYDPEDPSGQYPPLTSSMDYPPNWIGYRKFIEIDGAMVVSPYCRCAGLDSSGNGTVSIPELNPGNVPNWVSSGPGNPSPEWRDDSPNARINACLAHFKGCSPTSGQTVWSQKHPASHIACHCTQGGGGDVTRSPDFPYIWERPSIISASGEPTLKGMLEDPTLDPNNHHQLECWQWNLCDYAAGWLYKGPAGRNVFVTGASPESGGGVDNFDDWFDRCVCDPFQVNSAGQPTTYKTHRINTRWDYLCNLDYRLGTGPIKCANTVWEDGSTQERKLILRDPSGSHDPQGLAEDDAIVCECLRMRNYEGVDASRWEGAFDFREFIDGPDAGSELDILPLGVNQRYDADWSQLPPNDVLPPAQDYPIPALDGTATNLPAFYFGATGSLTTAFNALRWDGAGYDRINLSSSCNAKYCPIRHSGGLSIGCCTNPKTDANQNGIDDTMSPDVLNLVNGSHGNFMAFVNYCSEPCHDAFSRPVRVKNPSGALRNIREVQLVRELITGTGFNAISGNIDPVPPACGKNWDPGGSL